MWFTDVGGEVIDSDYRGPVVVIFLTFPNRYFKIKKVKHFAQIIFQKIVGLGTFGSSGNEKCLRKVS